MNNIKTKDILFVGDEIWFYVVEEDASGKQRIDVEKGKFMGFVGWDDSKDFVCIEYYGRRKTPRYLEVFTEHVSVCKTEVLCMVRDRIKSQVDELMSTLKHLDKKLDLILFLIDESTNENL
jgi:hypothetical protein